MNSLMNAFACPYQRSYCYATTSEVAMHPTDKNNIRIELQNQYFVDEETCYYQFFVPDEYLDRENMRYFWDIIFDET